jgi:EmrB/QacA subfamily drug resistance transporter
VAEAAAAAAPGAQSPPVSRGWGIALFVVVIGAFMSILDSSIVNIAIPTIENVFNVNTQGAEWVVTIYILALGVVVPASSWLGDKYGLKQIYIFSLAVFTLGSALCGASWSVGALAGFRVLQALGGGLIMPTTMSLVFRMVPRDRIGTAMGFWGLALIMAPAIGPTLGGYLVQYVDWRLIFYVNVPIGIVGVFLAMRYLPNLAGHPVGKLDWPGLATAAAGLFGLLLAFSEGQTWGWTSESIVLLLIGSCGVLALFVYLQMTGAEPLLDLRVFKYGSYTLTNILSMVVTVGMYAGVFYVPLFLQTVSGYGAMETGLIMMPAALVTAIFMPLAGRIYDRLGARWPVFIGLLFMGYGTYVFHNLSTATPAFTVAEWLMIRSIGMGLAMMPLTTAGMSAVPNPKIGAGSSINNILQRVSGAFGLAVLTGVLQGQTGAFTQTLSAAYVPGSAGAAFLSQIGQLAQAAGLGAAGGTLVQAYMAAGEIAKQAFVLAIDNVFVLTAAITLVGAAMALFVKTYRTAEGAAESGGPKPAMMAD